MVRYFSLITLFVFSVSSFDYPVFSQPGSLRINEFMALNQTGLTDEDGEYSDWIEIYNPSQGDVSLNGWSLTDQKNFPGKWIFPDVTIKSGSYLVVFASGKNRKIPGSNLHTNFKLSGDGEYLAFIDPSGLKATEFDPFFPEQQTDISFGYLDGTYISFLQPTPGSANLQSGGTLLPAPVLGTGHGFFEAPFDLTISCPDQLAGIYYTTDGSTPGEGNGILYTGPVTISTTSIIRAVAIKEDQAPSPIVTSTFIFPDEVIHQSNNPAGYPAEWGPYATLTGNAVADYEMDPEMISDPEFAASVREALLDIPTMSLVTDKGLLFSFSQNPDTGGIYIYTGPSASSLGADWERPVSFEYFDNRDSVSFQVNCGIKIQGGAGRLPEKSPKHSFRLVFKSIYGPSRLNFPLFGDDAESSINTIILRAGFGNSWIHWNHSERSMAQYLRDRWAKDTHLAMGHKASHGMYVHLYINGMYWGIYNPSERLDSDFAASYLDGSEQDFDVIKDYTEVVDGNLTAWNKMMAMADAGLTGRDSYQRIRGNNPDGTANPQIENMVDVVSLADYMLLNFYGGNWDWDHHNWVAIRNRVKPGSGFRFFCWDEEHILETVNANVLGENNANCPSRLFQQLVQNDDFRRLFADRVQRFCFNSGALTPGPALERWNDRASQIDQAVLAESARWGDYRRDVHPWQPAGPFDLYTKESYWLPQLGFMQNTYFPGRTDVFLAQLRTAGLFPAIDAPVFMINDNPVLQNYVSPGDILTMTSDEGVIYYTTDGSDPVVWQTSQDYSEKVLVAEYNAKQVMVPKADIGKQWREDQFYNTSGWKTSSGLPGGVGYEIATGYENMISLDVRDDMYSTGQNPNTSCYIRILFNISSGDLPALKSLVLRMRYDDGFVAYLNGKKVAAANAPANLAWNSASSGSHEQGAVATLFNISDFTGNLKAGDNLLAVQGLNTATSSTDFIINAELRASDRPSVNVSSSTKIYNGSIVIDESCHIKARTSSNGEWSATNERFFVIPGDFHDIKITEIHYHPLDEDAVSNSEFEFVEIKNTGTSTMDLGGLQFVNGIDFIFPPETQLRPKEFIVLASDAAYFYERYGFLPFDEYSGQLDNNGERLVLVGPEQDTLCSVSYSDGDGWPEVSDGKGYSLVPLEYNPDGSQDGPEHWRSSYHIGGSPGADDTNSPEGKSSDIVTLYACYPNPFSDITNISYQLHEEAFVNLSVYNSLGKQIVTLESTTKPAGNYRVEWNGLGQNNDRVANGIYFYRIAVRGKSGTNILANKLLLIR